MKNKFAVLLVLFFLPSFVWAENVRLKILVVGDTNDSSIGRSVANDMESYKKLAKDIGCAVKSEGVVTTLNVFAGDKCSYDSLKSFLESFSCKGDVVLFIYNGHGGRSHQDVSKFPRMCLGSNYVDKWMKVSELNETLSQKKPRLMVVVTDCCNSYYDRAGNDANEYCANTYQRTGEGFKELFLHSTGRVCITGSSPGEYGWALPQGGMLSLIFLNTIYSFDSKGRNASWQDLLQVVSDETYNTSLQYYNNRRISKTQRPLYDVNVSKSDFTNNIDRDEPDKDDINNVDDCIDDRNLNFDDEDLNKDEYFDDDGLYEDEEPSCGFGQAFASSFWIFIIGFLFIWVPDYIGIEGTFAKLMRFAGVSCFVWALIVFFSFL